MLSETQVLDKLSSRGQNDAGEKSGGPPARNLGPIPDGSLFSSAECLLTQEMGKLDFSTSSIF